MTLNLFLKKKENKKMLLLLLYGTTIGTIRTQWKLEEDSLFL